MKKIMFNERFGLQQAVLEGTKTMTRRISDYPAPAKYQPAYKVGEEIAIAQRYWELRNCDAFYEALQKADPTFPLECIRDEAGCHNKMFVKAQWMPHRIRIKSIKAERLQSISEADIMREGIHEGEFMNTWDRYYYDEWGDVANHITFKTPRLAFQSLIDKVCKRGTWKRNPWVYAYEFELVR